MNIGLFFGSFNPIHIGHLIIANYIASYTNIDELWLVVTPQNPLKLNNSLYNDQKRLQWVEKCVENNPKLKACDIEFHLTKPSYTIDTLSLLKEKYPQNNFSIIMGSDNLEILHLWKDYQKILEEYKIYVYPRLGEFDLKLQHPSIIQVNAPIIELSSTLVRELIQNKKSVQYIIHDDIRTEVEKAYYQFIN